MRTWDEVDDLLSYFLDDATDEESNRTFRERLRINAWNWAQNVFVAHTPLAKSCTLEVLADQRTGMLPSDFYAIDKIHATGEDRLLSTARRREGDLFYTDDDVLEYWLWGNQIKLESAYTAGGTDLTLYYWAYYPAMEFSVDADDGSVTVEAGLVQTPRWAEAALLHLTTAFCMSPGSAQGAYLGEWDTAQDSGNPTHNPRKEAVLFHTFMYDDLTGRFPKAIVGRRA